MAVFSAALCPSTAIVGPSVGSDRRRARRLAVGTFTRSRDASVVTGAALENGLLHVDLVREIPEAQKPRRIDIGTPAPAAVNTVDAKVVEAKAA